MYHDVDKIGTDFVRGVQTKRITVWMSGRYSQISSTSDVQIPFDEISNSKLKGISQNNNEGRGPITSSTVFHSLKAMQDVHLCMYVCMRVCTVYICFTR